jgi:hypothetical protein
VKRKEISRGKLIALIYADKRATPSGVEAFGSAVVHDKSGALGMDNPAETKPVFFAYFAS